MKTTNIVSCNQCQFTGPKDYFRLFDFGSQNINYICDKCLSRFPKTDSREWRREDHPEPDGSITWLDGTTALMMALPWITEAK